MPLNVKKLGIRQRQTLGTMLLRGYWPHTLRGNEYNVMKSLEKRGLVYKDGRLWRPSQSLRDQARVQRPGKEPGGKGSHDNHRRGHHAVQPAGSRSRQKNDRG